MLNLIVPGGHGTRGSKGDWDWIWGRVENADKDSLLVFQEAPFVLLVEEQRLTRMQAYTTGYEWELPRVVNWMSTGLGGQLTIFGAPENLQPIYGAHPLGVQFFLRFRLAPMMR